MFVVVMECEFETKIVFRSIFEKDCQKFLDEIKDSYDKPGYFYFIQELVH